MNRTIYHSFSLPTHRSSVLARIHWQRHNSKISWVSVSTPLLRHSSSQPIKNNFSPLGPIFRTENLLSDDPRVTLISTPHSVSYPPSPASGQPPRPFPADPSRPVSATDPGPRAGCGLLICETKQRNTIEVLLLDSRNELNYSVAVTSIYC
jgi:hypothetical protein